MYYKLSFFQHPFWNLNMVNKTNITAMTWWIRLGTTIKHKTQSAWGFEANSLQQSPWHMELNYSLQDPLFYLLVLSLKLTQATHGNQQNSALRGRGPSKHMFAGVCTELSITCFLFFLTMLHSFQTNCMNHLLVWWKIYRKPWFYHQI